MFSITASLVRLFVSWNVRTIPILAVLCGATPLISMPSNCHRPRFGSSNPVSRLKNVVLPAPFGPIRAVIEPRWTSTCSTSTAIRPPKWRTMSRATRIGSGFGTAGLRLGTSRAPPWRQLRRRRRGGWRRRHRPSKAISLRLPNTPCGRNTISSISIRPDQRERDLPDLGRLDQREVADLHRTVLGELAQRVVDEHEDRPEQHRPDDRARHLRHTAEHQRRQHVERHVAAVVVGLHGTAVEGEDHPRERADHAAEDQRLHLVAVDVLAEAAHRSLVLADRLQHPPPRALHQDVDERPEDARRAAQPTISVHISRPGEREPPEPVLVGLLEADVGAEPVGTRRRSR